jgi:hypothetical protein
LKAKLAIAALVATTLGLGAVSAFAQGSGSSASPAAMNSQMNGPRPMHGMHMKRGDMPMGPRFLMLVCSDRGAEQLDVAFTRLSHRLGDLTADQKKLFDALREKALTTQTKFLDSCQAAMPAKGDGAPVDLLERMKAGIGVEEARLAAIKTVLPAFEAFYNSLTDAQKASLLPQPRDRGLMFDHGAKGKMIDGPDAEAPADNG